MAKYVESERLWPMLAYFTAAVVVVVAVSLLGSGMEISSEARIGLVVGWMVLLPAGAWWVWRRTAPKK